MKKKSLSINEQNIHEQENSSMKAAREFIVVVNAVSHYIFLHTNLIVTADDRHLTTQFPEQCSWCPIVIKWEQKSSAAIVMGISDMFFMVSKAQQKTSAIVSIVSVWSLSKKKISLTTFAIASRTMRQWLSEDDVFGVSNDRSVSSHEWSTSNHDMHDEKDHFRHTNVFVHESVAMSKQSEYFLIRREYHIRHFSSTFLQFMIPRVWISNETTNDRNTVQSFGPNLHHNKQLQKAL